MNPRIDLIWFGRQVPAWPLGQSWPTELTVSSIHARLQQLADSEADALLFWDGSMGAPDVTKVLQARSRPGDLWHAGLRLGMEGLPGLLEAIAPNWMLMGDPKGDIEATSWRVTLRACLMKTDVLRQMGNLRQEFQTWEGAALEWGHRCVTRGVFMRHLPWLVPTGVPVQNPTIPLEDSLRFVLRCFGKFWSRWALFRAVLTGEVRAVRAWCAWARVIQEPTPSQPAPYTRSTAPVEDVAAARVSILIPTVDRYPYLRTLLSQIRQQTVRPFDVIVIDQTDPTRRDTRLAEEFGDLPLTILYQDEPGQCASRNAGLQRAGGDYILFIDDDDEIDPTLIETHLQNLHRCRADVSSGVSDELGAGPLPEAFTYTRISDVFPTNNTLVRREVLQASGLFDLAYNRGQRADGDLGVRIYNSGALMVLNPEISVFHHHAPSGGLRLHKARVITYASSRSRLMHRQLLSATEIYLSRRYYSPRHTQEMMWHSVLGTFSIRGEMPRKLLKALIGFVCLPHSLWVLRCRYVQAMEMLKKFPQIPRLGNRDFARGTGATHALRETAEGQGGALD